MTQDCFCTKCNYYFNAEEWNITGKDEDGELVGVCDECELGRELDEDELTCYDKDMNSFGSTVENFDYDFDYGPAEWGNDY